MSHIIICIFGVLCIIFYFCLAIKNFDRFTVSHAPEILTTMGIGFCFLGLTVGFAQLNDSNLFQQMPELIESLKWSFPCSLAGIVGALVIKLKHRFTKNSIQQSAHFPKSATMDDLICVMNSLKSAIVGNEQGSLVTEIKLLRQEQSYISHKMLDCFNNFSEKMTENNSKALIGALKEVIMDFNSKINEQFGENFKELNSAVKDLVVWQRQYKEELEIMKQVQSYLVEDLKTASDKFSQIVCHSEKFVEITASLDIFLNNMEKSMKEGYFTSESLIESLSSLKQVAPEFSQKTHDFVEDLKLRMHSIFSNIEAHEKNLVSSVQSSHVEMKNLLTQTIRETSNDTASHVKKICERMNEQVVALDEALDKELNKSMLTLGKSLSSLSLKFVEDYNKITDKFRHVLDTVESMSNMMRN